MFQAHPVGILALVAVAMCLALAVTLYRVESASGAARMLALLLVVEGVTLITTGYIDLMLTPAVTASSGYPAWNRAEQIVHTFGDCVFLALYPPFLAAALQTKLTRPFAGTRMRIGLAGVSVALFFVAVLSPPTFGTTLLYFALVMLFGFALVASIHAWYVATGIARPRARAFAFAFGIRDGFWGFVYATGITMIWFEQYRVVDSEATSPIYLVYIFGTLFAVPLIAYGILRTHLFDIDLRIRWTIKQSTVAAVFVTIFYLVSEGADRLLESEFGTIAGLIASALVVFFLVPVQRFAERVAGAAMPNTENTPEYAMFRKLQVYEAALAEALPDGNISDRERDLLDRLRDSLGISTADADAIEHELQEGLPSIG
jgi:hypothetical protein